MNFYFILFKGSEKANILNKIDKEGSIKFLYK